MSAVKSVFQGAILTVSMRWIDRLIGLISMMVLARLLTPADFGIIAMASVVASLVDVLLDLGVRMVLVHNRHADQEDYNVAWTIGVLQASLVALVIVILAPFAVEYFKNPLVADVLRVMALSVFIAGFENVGIVSFQKNMEFGKDFQFFFFRRLIGFLSTLIAAWFLRNYWALAIGTLAGRTSGVIISYLLHPFRPRVSFSRFKSLWSFSQWILVRNIGDYLNRETDRILLGGRSGAELTGEYVIADEVASMPTTELLMPLGRVLFPIFVKKRDDVEAFSESVSTAIGVQALVAIPACVGLFTVANEAVLSLLGEKWIIIVPLIQILAIVNLVIALTHCISFALLSLGRIKILAAISWIQALFFLCIAVFIFPKTGPDQIALLRLLAVSVGAGTLLGIVLFHLKVLRISAFFSSLIRPTLSTIVMGISLYKIQWMIVDMPAILGLFMQVGIGFFVYLALILFLWFIAGKPKGAESYLLKNILAQGMKLIGKKDQNSI